MSVNGFLTNALMCSNPLVETASQRTRIATEFVISGRKSWKTLKEKNEAVWPPYLEAALIEGWFGFFAFLSTYNSFFSSGKVSTRSWWGHSDASEIS